MWTRRPGPPPGAMLGSEGDPNTTGAMLSRLCCHQGSMVSSGSGLWPTAMSGSIALPQPGSMLIFTVLVSIEGCVTVQTVAPTWTHVGVQEPRCCWTHAARSDPCCCSRSGDVRAQVPAYGHVWVCDPAATGICVVVYYPCHRRSPFEPCVEDVGGLC